MRLSLRVSWFCALVIGVTTLEAFVQSVVDRVLQGDSKAIPELMKLCAKAKLFKFVTDPTRLTGVVVPPEKYWRDYEQGIQGGWYAVGDDGLGFWVDPITKQEFERQNRRDSGGSSTTEP
jgi:hypothetical protein